MNQTATLTATHREQIGTRYSRRIRQGGGLPAVVYGHGVEPAAITLNAKEALRRFRAGEKVFTLDLGGKQETVLLKDLQFDYLGDTIVHADFARVDLDEMVEVNVPVKLVGEAAGLKHAGAVLLHPVTELAIRCRVAAIPDNVVADISALEVGEAMYVRDITLPAGAELLSEEEGVVATIHMKVEEVATPEAEAAEGAPTEPEVIREKKPAEDAEEK